MQPRHGAGQHKNYCDKNGQRNQRPKRVQMHHKANRKGAQANPQMNNPILRSEMAPRAVRKPLTTSSPPITISMTSELSKGITIVRVPGRSITSLAQQNRFLIWIMAFVQASRPRRD
jgi:hypothetical protein